MPKLDLGSFGTQVGVLGFILFGLGAFALLNDAVGGDPMPVSPPTKDFLIILAAAGLILMLVGFALLKSDDAD